MVFVPHFKLSVAFVALCLCTDFLYCHVSDTQGFRSNAKDLLSIFSKSIYKKPSHFIRELLSNSADALDIKKLQSLTLGGGFLEESKITIACDPANNQLVFIDNGCGMSDAEMKEHLGTFAKSGTREKLETLKSLNSSVSSDSIGQFGLGFYSTFIVADTVTVISRKYSSPGSNDTYKKYAWTCNIHDGTYSIREIDDDDLLEQTFPITSGTKIILNLSNSLGKSELMDESEKIDYLNPDTLKFFITEYSQYIRYPIYLVYNKTVTTSVPLNITETAAEPDSVQLEEDPESKEKIETISTEETIVEHVNTQRPIWTEPSSNVSDEQYNEFYKITFKDRSDPILHYRNSGSSSVDFQYLIYFPKISSFQPFSNDAPQKFLRLYVKKIFVTDEFNDMFPRYLSFIRGVVDLEDLQLNISRESLQDLSVLKNIFKHLTTKIISLIQGLTKNVTEYEPFYKQYSGHIKLGIITEKDQKRKDSLMSVLYFRSSAFINGTFLDSYIERMQKNQSEIYFVTGNSIKEMRKLPQIEQALKRGYEVLYLDDTFDEYVVQGHPSYKGKALTNLVKAGISLSDEVDKQRMDAAQKKFKPLITYMKKIFQKNIEKVIISSNLDRSSIAISAGATGFTPQMERIMKGNKNDPMAQFYLNQKKVLEINPEHPLMLSMLDEIVSAGSSTPGDEFDKNLNLLYYSAILHSGYDIPNPADFALQIEDMLRAKYELIAATKRDITPEDLIEKEGPSFSFANDDLDMDLGADNIDSEIFANNSDFDTENDAFDLNSEPNHQEI